ncbi:MAG: hypothetical protein NC314_01705 [Roseburia sp.]|nr:hypothetical protein [Roseburia sp.]MCM1241530.1 hypothetical protein [Roseburia sp.]
MKKAERKENNWIVILGIAVLASLPLLSKGIYRGHDIAFHLLRIEGIAEGLKRLCFPVRMQSLWLEGYGYPVSIYYGDLLLYFPAMLRLLGIPVITAYKIYVLFVNIATTATAYFCFGHIWSERKIAVVVSMAYVTSAYRLVDIYVRAAVGEYSAMLFFPFIALSIFQIYKEKENDKTERHKNAFWLCLGMTGLLESHILSTEMMIFMLILVCIMLWKRTFRKTVLLTYLSAIADTLFLNLYFIVPFLDYYSSMCANVNADMRQIKQIQSSGAYPLQYIGFFRNIFGLDSIHIEERMQLSPGPLLLLALIPGFIIHNKKKNKKVSIYLFFSLFILFFSSNLFPWDFLAEHFIVGNMLAQVQFPWRYLAIAVLFLTLLLGEVLQEFSVRYQSKMTGWLMIMTGIAVFMTCHFTENYLKNTERIYYSKAEEMNSYEVGAGEEFLLTGTDITALSGNISGNFKTADLLKREGTHMELFVVMEDAGGYVELPMFAYKGYCVTDEQGTEYIISAGSNNRLRFEMPVGYTGKIYVDFRVPWYWHVSDVISLVSLMGCLYWMHKVRIFSGQTGKTSGYEEKSFF